MRWLAAAEPWATASEQEAAGRRAGVEAQAQHLVGRAAIKLLAAAHSGEDPRTVAVALTRAGKPYLPDQPQLHVSIAHCRGVLAAACCPQVAVGVDVERVASGGPEPARLATRWFDPRAAAALAGSDTAAARRDLVRYWTCKEAVGKALGLGIEHSLAGVVVDLDGAQPRLLALPAAVRASSASASAPYWTLYQSALTAAPEAGTDAGASTESAAGAAGEPIWAVALAGPDVSLAEPLKLSLAQLGSGLLTRR